MAEPLRILMLSNCPRLDETFRQGFEARGYRTYVVGSFERLSQRLDFERYTLVFIHVLEDTKPAIDFATVLGEARQPVVVITASSDEEAPENVCFIDRRGLRSREVVLAALNFLQSCVPFTINLNGPKPCPKVSLTESLAVAFTNSHAVKIELKVGGESVDGNVARLSPDMVIINVGDRVQAISLRDIKAVTLFEPG